MTSIIKYNVEVSSKLMHNLKNRGAIFGSNFGGSHWKYCGTILKIRGTNLYQI
jgi:hypothetical protein